MSLSAKEISRLQQSLLRWYDKNSRDLPWRYKDGRKPDPYHVWLSEIMLQQTTVAAVQPYFLRFIEHWPNIAALAKAEQADVLRLWAGLGYYARARNLHAAAQQLVQEHHGRMPDNIATLRQIKGIGEYTASAIAAFAFGQAVLPIDGNLERVFSRLLAIKTAPPQLRKIVWQQSAVLTPKQRAGDMAQALMDIGARICLPKNPRCDDCPLAPFCAAKQQGLTKSLPQRVQKQAKPYKRAVAVWLELGQGKKAKIWLRRRPQQGLLGGMLEVPSSAWLVAKTRAPWADAAKILAEMGLPPKAGYKANYIEGVVRHVFTHFILDVRVILLRLPRLEKTVSQQLHKQGEALWWPKQTILQEPAQIGLPSLMQKIAALACAG